MWRWGFINRNVQLPSTQTSNSHLCYLFVGFRWGWSFKWWVSNQTLKAENPNTPQVHLLTVSATLNHLWREVVKCAAHCPSPANIFKDKTIVCYCQHEPNCCDAIKKKKNSLDDSSPQRRCVDRPTKVCNFQLPSIAQEQIFWLDVTVNHLLLMTVNEGIRYLLHELKMGKRFAYRLNFNFLQIKLFSIKQWPFSNGLHHLTQARIVKSNKASLWLCAGHQIFHISGAPCTFHPVGHIRAPSTPFSGHGNNCRSARCLGAWK